MVKEDETETENQPASHDQGPNAAVSNGSSNATPSSKFPECEQTCKRHFWTELLRSITKITGLILAAFGLSSIDPKD